MRVKVLGSAAGGGFPQWNCACGNCRRLRAGTFSGKARTQVQVAVTADSRDWYLLNASPDILRQIEATPELHPVGESRHTPIAAVALSSGDLDQVLGLILLRESQPLRVYATDSLRRLLVEDNSMLRMLQKQLSWTPVTPGTAYELTSVSGVKSGITCFPIPLAGQFPRYVSAERAAGLNPADALLGFQIETPQGKKLIYMPGVPRLEASTVEYLNACDLLLFDATFWVEDELIRIQGSGPTASQMGHMPISGPSGSLALLANVRRPRKIYAHINNTNPILDEASPEHRQVRDAGWEIAHDGMEFEL